jgi:nucleotide-binding universal stress UspA family protein
MTEDRIRLLIPLDEGDSVVEAGRLLRAIFRPEASEALAFHVAPVAAPLFYLPAGLDADALRHAQATAERKASETLAARLDPLRQKGIRVDAEATSGSPLSEILRRAASWRADFVVVGAGRRAGRLGGVAAGLLQCAPSPVLLHREIPEGFRIGRVVVATDGSPFARRAGLWGVLVAALADATTLFVHVLPESSANWSEETRQTVLATVVEELERARHEAREFGYPPDPIESLVLTARNPEDGLLEDRKEGDLLVLGGSGRTGLSSVLGSVTRRMARDARGPLLVVPATAGRSPIAVGRAAALARRGP